MYVCNCNGLNEDDVRIAITKDGARTPDDIYEMHACKVQCGKCVPDMIERLAAHGINVETPQPQVSTCQPSGCGVTSPAVRNPAHDAPERSY